MRRSAPDYSALRRIPAHHRPFVLAMVLPLATACLIHAPAYSGRAAHVVETLARQEMPASAERQRRSEIFPGDERRLDDPHARTSQENRAEYSPSASAASTSSPKFSLGLPAELFTREEPNVSLKSAALSGTGTRGPPRGDDK